MFLKYIFPSASISAILITYLQWKIKELLDKRIERKFLLKSSRAKLEATTTIFGRPSHDTFRIFANLADNLGGQYLPHEKTQWAAIIKIIDEYHSKSSQVIPALLNNSFLQRTPPWGSDPLINGHRDRHT